MLSYTYSLTKEQLLDCAKMYRSKTLKPSIILIIIMLAAFGALFGLAFVDGFAYLRYGAWFFLFLGFFLSFVVIVSKKSVKAQNELYFKSCQVDGIISYEFQICETEFVVLQPQKGNVHHYLYETIAKVFEFNGYAAVLLAGNQYFPILLNEYTRPLVNTLKSYVKTK